MSALVPNNYAIKSMVGPLLRLLTDLRKTVLLPKRVRRR